MFPVRRDRNPGAGLVRRQEGDVFSPSSFLSGSPWQIMQRMQEDMDRLFGQFLGGGPDATQGEMGMRTMGLSPHVDVSEDEREFCVDMDLPGFRPEDIDIQIQDGQMMIRAQTGQDRGSPPDQQGTNRQYLRRERRYGMVQQTFTLPQNVDEANIRADFRDGVLTMHLPKQEPSPSRGRRIAVGGQEQGAIGQRAGSETGAQPPGVSSFATAGTPGPSMAGAKGGERGGETGADAGESRNESSPGVDATPGLGGVGSGDPGGVSPQAPIVNDERGDTSSS